MIPGKEADAPKHCLAQGCDVIAQHTDHRSLQVAEQQGHIGFGQASDPIQICSQGTVDSNY